MTVSRIVVALFAGSLATAALTPAHAGSDGFTKTQGADNDITSQLPAPPPSDYAAPQTPPKAAVAIPAFMKNARKAKTAEGPARLQLKSR